MGRRCSFFLSSLPVPTVCVLYVVLDEARKKWVRKIPNKISLRLDTIFSIRSCFFVNDYWIGFAQHNFCPESHVPSLSFYSRLTLAREKQAFFPFASRGTPFRFPPLPGSRSINTERMSPVWSGLPSSRFNFGRLIAMFTYFGYLPLGPILRRQPYSHSRG